MKENLEKSLSNLIENLMVDIKTKKKNGDKFDFEKESLSNLFRYAKSNPQIMSKDKLTQYDIIRGNLIIGSNLLKKDLFKEYNPENLKGKFLDFYNSLNL